MSIKSILCAYSSEAARGSGLAHAVKLAVHHDAHLTGVLRHGRNLMEQRYGAQLPQTVIDQMIEADNALVAASARRFSDAAAAGGLADRSEFVELNPAADGELSAFCRAFDLIVTGVHSDAAHESHLSVYPDTLALRSGRPVLVVPDGYTSEGLAARALVAWDGKRSAARAISDAMDILVEKAGVTLLSVGGTPSGTDRLLANMQRHGIDVTARTVPRSGSVGGTILAEAQADGAHLIVMGAFEHSKFSHDLFGGVTTDVIKTASVPVFMVH